MKIFISILLLSLPAQAAELKTYIKFKDRDANLSKTDKLTCNTIDSLLIATKNKISLGSIVTLTPSHTQAKIKKACGYTEPKGQALLTASNEELFDSLGCEFGCPDHNHFQIPDITKKPNSKK
jgi:hypothetical protein